MLLFVYFRILTIVLSNVLSADSLMKNLTDLSEINAPTDIGMKETDLGELTISWNSNLSEELHRMFEVDYQINLKFNDSDGWQKVTRVPELEYKEDLELHKGVQIQVKNILIEKKKIVNSREVESNWTEAYYMPTLGDPGTAAADIACLVYNNSFMNCSWQIGPKAPEDIMYFLYYRDSFRVTNSGDRSYVSWFCPMLSELMAQVYVSRQTDETRTCTEYIKDERGRHIGCHIGHNGVDTEEETVILLVNGSSHHNAIQPFYKIFKPLSFEKFNPPINVQVVNRTVKWDIPDNPAIENPKCFAYLLNLKDWTDNTEQNINVTEMTVYKLPNYIPSKRYSVKVSLALKFCGASEFWSDWSNEVFIEAEYTERSFFLPMFIALMVIVNLIILLLIYMVKRAVRKMLVPIPDPKRIFKGLSEEYNGDFQMWLDFKEQIWVADECKAAIIEEN